MKDLIIIGGGPAGLMAAYAAVSSRPSANIVIIEKNSELGVKLKITGNGKCNYSNATIGDKDNELDYTNYNFDKASKYAEMLRTYDSKWLEKLFFDLGMMTYQKGDLKYPKSEQSASVLSALLNSISTDNVKIVTSVEATGISKSDDGFQIMCSNKVIYTAKSVLIATGGKAAPKTGSVGGGYKLAKAMGHTVSFTYPGLTKLCVDSKKNISLSECAGVRAKALVKAVIDGQTKATEAGEVQFLKDALSGICVFNLSRFMSKAIEEGKKCQVIIDFMPDTKEEELKSLIDKQLKGHIDLESVLLGFVPAGIAKYISYTAGEDPQKATKLLKNTVVDIVAHGTYDEAQVTIGGVSMDEIDPANMESVKTKGLYLAGEVIDVDGACGGYNLHFAFASGFVSGSSAVK